DGFRVDVMWHLIKDERLRDNPPNPDYKPGMSPYFRYRPNYSVDQPEVHGIVAAMRKILDGYPERVLIGEIYLPVKSLVSYYGRNNDEAHLPFNFQLITLRSEDHTSELQSRENLVCRLLLEKKNQQLETIY